MTEIIRKCSKCKESLSVSSFWKDASTKDGLSYYCKACWKIAHKEHRKKYATAEYNRRKRDREPLKNAARVILNNAVSLKKIVKEPCVFCGDDKVDGHHLLYEFPLVIVWVCRKHHHEIHAQSKHE